MNIKYVLKKKEIMNLIDKKNRISKINFLGFNVL